VQLGFKTILVLSGGTRREDLAHYAYRPDKVVESIADLHHTDLLREFSSPAPTHAGHGTVPLGANHRTLTQTPS
jgi:NagD protein